MKWALCTWFLVLEFGSTVWGQRLPSRELTVCSLLQDAAAYSGKLVSVRANVIMDYHGSFLNDETCQRAIPLVLPEASTQTPSLTLVKDDVYQRFDAALHDFDIDTGQPKRRIRAVFRARFEFLSGDGPNGRGPLGVRWQLVLVTVSNLVLQ